mgnify:CR=1 FL=1
MFIEPQQGIFKTKYCLYANLLKKIGTSINENFKGSEPANSNLSHYVIQDGLLTI